jgi:holo-[acyl-carrier protein] synthase
MESLSIGVDIEDVDVWETLVPSKRWRWFSPLFAAEELAYGLQQTSPAASLGGLFAAKEAVIKALWPALELTPRQIAIVHEGGKPAARIDHPASRQWTCDVSITHSRLSVVAVCLARCTRG